MDQGAMKTAPLTLILLAIMLASPLSPTAAEIWQWVDRDGILTFSDSKPPAHVRDAILISTTAAPNLSRHGPARRVGAPERRAAPAVNHLCADSGGTPCDTDGRWPADEVILVADVTAEEPQASWAYDCCLRYVDPYAIYNAYAPFTDYAYTRRYPHRLYRGSGRHLRKPSYRRHLSHYRRQHYFGTRHYDREYFSSAYRYRATTPSYHRFRRTPLDGRPPYGLNRHEGRSNSRIFRSGRAHHGARFGDGRVRGYRGGSGFGTRR
jgi:hypothetical protein